METNYIMKMSSLANYSMKKVYFLYLTRKRLVDNKNLFFKSVLAEIGSSTTIHTDIEYTK